VSAVPLKDSSRFRDGSAAQAQENYLQGHFPMRAEFSSCHRNEDGWYSNLQPIFRTFKPQSFEPWLYLPRILLATQKWQSALSAKYSGEACFLSSTNHAQKVAT